MQLGAFWRTHAAGVVLALLSGLILGLPHLNSKARSPYLQVDEVEYAAQTEHVRRGHWSYSDVYLIEALDTPSPYPRLTQQIAAGMAWLVGGSDTLYRISDFIFPPGITFALYLTLCRLGVRRSVSLLVSSVYVLHHTDLFVLLEPATRHTLYDLAKWYAFPWPLGSMLHTESPTLSRFPNPLLPRLVEMGFFLLLFPALNPGRPGAIARVGAGVLLASVTYLRFVDWTVLYPALAIGALILFRVNHRPAALRLTMVIALGLLLSAPNWVPSLAFTADPAMEEVLMHSGLQRTSRLFPLELRYVYPVGPLCLLALALAAFGMGVKSRGRIAFAALSWGMIPAVTFQVVTGWTVCADHWYHQHILPIFSAALALGFGLLAFRGLKEFVARTAVLAAVGISTLHAVGMFAMYEFVPIPHVEEVRRALAGVEADSVVLNTLPEETKVLAPHTYSFMTSAPWSTVRTEELLTRYLLGMKLYGVPVERVESLFGSGFHPDVWGLIAGSQYMRYSSLDTPEKVECGLPSDQRIRWVELYRALPDDPDALVAQIRAQRRLDYVLVTPREAKLGTPLGADRWPVAFRGTLVTLYRVP